MEYADAFCKKPETKQINEKLKALYNTWYLNCVEPFRKSSFSEQERLLNPLHLLTCTDSYLGSENKTIVFGQESHDTKNEHTLWDWAPVDYYLEESSYAYSKSIHEGNRKLAPKTLFLKQRFKLAGLDPKGNLDSDVDKLKFESILLNNLNKTSYKGSHTPIKKDGGILDKLYQNIEFEGKKLTIFEHEVCILRPDRIIIMCGRSYLSHLKRDFKTMLSFQNIDEAVKKLSINNCLVSAPIQIAYEESLTSILLTYHPNAHMTTYQRCDYDNKLRAFIAG